MFIEDISGVSSSQVEMSSIQFYDGICTDEIQQILIKSFWRISLDIQLSICRQQITSL